MEEGATLDLIFSLASSSFTSEAERGKDNTLTVYRWQHSAYFVLLKYSRFFGEQDKINILSQFCADL